MIEKSKNPLMLLLEVLIKNIFWYLIFSLIYFDLNPLNWWLVQSSWGRLLLVILELILINNTNSSINKDTRFLK